jgi:hypothetical protein
MRNSFYYELKRVFHKFPKYGMNTLLHFTAKVNREDILKPQIGTGSLHEISNDNEVRVVNFPTTKLSLLEYNVPLNFIEHLLMERLTIKLIVF